MHIRRLAPALGLVVALQASAQALVDRASRDELAFMSNEDPAMQQAFRKAQESLDEFLRIAAKSESGIAMRAVKVALSEGPKVEYFWVTDFELAGDRFQGSLANEPRLVGTYQKGQRLAFTRSQVVDWLYVDKANRRMVGNFTACALLTKEPPDQARRFMAQYGLQCD